MSRASRITLWVACGVSFGTIIYVHFKQWWDHQKLHEGVIKDVERQQRKKIENLYFLEKQIEMSRILKNQQKEDEAVALQLIEDSKKNNQ